MYLSFCALQLRYYDEKEDAHCRGFIDLAEVINVSSTKPIAGAPKKADENAFFEVWLLQLRGYCAAVLLVT